MSTPPDPPDPPDRPGPGYPSYPGPPGYPTYPAYPGPQGHPAQPGGTPYGSPMPTGQVGYGGYGSPGGYATMPGRPGSPVLAIIAFVLSLMACLVVSWLVSIGLAIAALVRSRRGPGHGRGWAIAALAIDAVWVVLVLAFLLSPAKDSFTEGFRQGMSPDAPRDASGTITERADIDPAKVRVGDCLDDPVLVGKSINDSGDPKYLLSAVPCAEAHQLEVFHIYDLEGTTYPGDSTVRRRIESTCQSEFTGYVGESFRRSKLRLFYYYPTDQAWAAGDHTAICMVSDRDGSHLGSFRDSTS